jgi:hypothetical protein
MFVKFYGINVALIEKLLCYLNVFRLFREIAKSVYCLCRDGLSVCKVLVAPTTKILMKSDILLFKKIQKKFHFD